MNPALDFFIAMVALAYTAPEVGLRLPARNAYELFRAVLAFAALFTLVLTADAALALGDAVASALRALAS